MLKHHGVGVRLTKRKVTFVLLPWKRIDQNMPENEQKHDQVKPFSKLIKVSTAGVLKANFIHMEGTENVGSYIKAFVLSLNCIGLH